MIYDQVHEHSSIRTSYTASYSCEFLASTLSHLVIDIASYLLNIGSLVDYALRL